MESSADIYKISILVVEDDKDLRNMLIRLLEKEGYTAVSYAESVKKAFEIVKLNNPQAYILDVMLPDGNGFDFLRKLRQESSAPVLFLSARDEDEARLRGLGLGADDYITKPFLPKELLLRLSAVLRRTYPLEVYSSVEPVSLGNIEIDMNNCTVKGNKKGASLTATEFAIIKKLSANRGNIVTMDALARAVWGDDIGYENTLMVHMRRLREKVEEDPSHPKWIITVRGLGYRMLKDVSSNG